MFSIKKCPVPTNIMLERYARNGSYVDCYMTEISGYLFFREYIVAFYTTGPFRLERMILRLVVSKPSTDMQAEQLAERTGENFVAWHVEDRSENEMLLCDFVGRTRSWLMTVPIHTGNGVQTQLYFGSAVVPKRNPKTGKLSLGFGYQALLGFHKIYSVLLLYSAKLHMQGCIRNSNEKQDQFHR